MRSCGAKVSDPGNSAGKVGVIFGLADEQAPTTILRCKGGPRLALRRPCGAKEILYCCLPGPLALAKPLAFAAKASKLNFIFYC